MKRRLNVCTENWDPDLFSTSLSTSSCCTNCSSNCLAWSPLFLLFVLIWLTWHYVKSSFSLNSWFGDGVEVFSDSLKNEKKKKEREGKKPEGKNHLLSVVQVDLPLPPPKKPTFSLKQLPQYLQSCLGLFIWRVSISEDCHTSNMGAIYMFYRAIKTHFLLCFVTDIAIHYPVINAQQELISPFWFRNEQALPLQDVTLLSLYQSECTAASEQSIHLPAPSSPIESQYQNCLSMQCHSKICSGSSQLLILKNNPAWLSTFAGNMRANKQVQQ